MKKSAIFVLIILITGLFLSFTSFFSEKNSIKKEKYLSIENAVKNKIISAELKGSSTYSGDAINLKIKNISPVDTIIRIEAGRRWTSIDSSEQDILIVKELDVFLAANEQKQLNLFGFCCQSNNGAPNFNSNFNVGFMEDSSFIKLAQFLNKSELPINVMQNAIWVLSNNHSLNSIHNDKKENAEKMKELFQLLSYLKKIVYVFPWYTLTYKTDTSRVFSNRPNYMFAEIEYYLPHQSSVDLLIRDSKNLIAKKIFIEKPHHQGNYNYKFDLDVGNFPKGKYYFRLYADNQMIMEKEFEL